MAAITIERVSRVFAGGHAGVRDVDLVIPDGELVVLVGPSGSGKSTLLRLIAGLDHPTTGRILIGGRDVTDVPPQARDLAMVFQSYALYPHKTVRENLAFGLRMRGRPPAEIAARVTEIAGVLQIDGLLDRRPAQLSGGQRQRVALGRAMVRGPQAFLFDEPLSNLDPALRLETRAELAQLHRRLGATMVYVTHDQEEAMTLAQRLVILRDGCVQQQGSPADIYRNPGTAFVGRFLGSPPMNLIDAALLEAGRIGVAGIRPHDLSLAAPAAGDLDATVDLVETTGAEQHVHLRLDAAPGVRVIAVLAADADVQVGARTGLRIRRDRLHFFADRGTRPA